MWAPVLVIVIMVTYSRNDPLFTQKSRLYWTGGVKTRAVSVVSAGTCWKVQLQLVPNVHPQTACICKGHGHADGANMQMWPCSWWTRREKRIRKKKKTKEGQGTSRQFRGAGFVGTEYTIFWVVVLLFFFYSFNFRCFSFYDKRLGLDPVGGTGFADQAV